MALPKKTKILEMKKLQSNPVRYVRSAMDGYKFEAVKNEKGLWEGTIYQKEEVFARLPFETSLAAVELALYKQGLEIKTKIENIMNPGKFAEYSVLTSWTSTVGSESYWSS